MLWIAVTIIVGILVVDFFIHLIFALIVLPVFEHKPPFSIETDPESPLAQKVSIPSTNGITLTGSLYRSNNNDLNKLIIFCPEFGSSHRSAARYCKGLIDSGFNVLSFDFRNQGESDSLKGYEPLHWMTNYELEDVLSVIKFIKNDAELSSMNLGLYGISRGGSAAIAAAAHYPEIKSVTVEGLFSSASLILHFTLRWASLYAPSWVLDYTPTWHVKTTLYLTRRISGFRKRCRFFELENYLCKLEKTSIYLIVGEQDSYVSPQISKNLIQQTGSPNTEIWEVKGARHNMARTICPEEYDERLIRFFSKNNDLCMPENVETHSSI